MDIDIDFPTSFTPATYFPTAIPASMVKNECLVKHPCGQYFQTIPVDPITNLAAIPYDKANDCGYTKIDFLHLSLLDNFDNKQQIRTLIKTEPDWSLLLDPTVVEKLFQLHNHVSILQQIAPKSVVELADCIALIRPTKRQYLQQYLNNRTAIRPLLYRQDSDDKSAFRKSHAISYALTIVLQLHLIKAGIV